MPNGETVIERMVAEFGADATEMLAAFALIDKAAGQAQDRVSKTAKESERDVRKMARAMAAEIRKASEKVKKANEEAAASARAAAEEAAAASQQVADAITATLAGAGLAVGAFAVGAIAEIVRVGKKVVEEAVTFDEMSRRIAVTTEQLSTLEFTVKRFGFTLGELEGILAGTQETFEVTGEDAEKVDEVLQGIGTSLADIKGLTADQQLLEIADAFSKTEDETTKVKAATALYGAELGTRLIPLLEEGRSGIEAIQAEARAFGVEISSEFARKAVEFETSLMRLQASQDVFARSIAMDAVPAINDILEAYLEGAVAGDRFEGTINALTVAWEKWSRTVASTEGAEASIAQLEDIDKEIRQVQAALREREGFSISRALFGEDGLAETGRTELEATLKTLREQRLLFERGLQDDLKAEQERRQKEREEADAAFQKRVNARRIAAAEERARRELQIQENLEKNVIAATEAQLRSVEGLTKAERLRQDLASGEFKDFSANSKQRLQFLADEIERVEAINKARREAKALADEQARRDEQARQFAANEIENLRTQIQIAQARNEIEAARIKFSTSRFAALSEEQRLELETLTIRLQGIEDEKAKREELENFAKQIVQENLTLEQQRIDAVNRLNEAFEAGFFTQEQLRVALDMTNQKFDELGERAEAAALQASFAGTSAAKQLGDDFEEFLFDPSKRGFLEMAANFSQALADMAAEALKNELIKNLFGGIQGGRGAGQGLLGGLFAEGGAVHGPGTSTSDSILARLSDGEFVIRAAAVKAYGPEVFESMNRMVMPRISVPAVNVNVPKVPRFQDGGMVAAPPEDTGEGGGVDLAVVNLHSQQAIEAYIASRAGRTTILNSLGSDGGHELRKIVGS